MLSDNGASEKLGRAKKKNTSGDWEWRGGEWGEGNSPLG